MSTHRRTLSSFKRRQLEVASTLKMSHPCELPADFQSPANIKDSIKDTRHTCFHCEKPEPKVGLYKICANCRLVYYCSRECQKLDWPSHKDHCVESERKKRLEKFFAALYSNRNLYRFLNIATTLQLGLQNSPVPVDLFTVVIDMVVEPEDIREFARLRGNLEARSPTSPRRKIKGMLQIGGIMVLPNNLEPKEDVLSRVKATLELRHNNMELTPDCAFGTVIFSMRRPNSTGLEQATSIMSSMITTPDIMHIAREAQPFVQLIPSTGETRTKPMTTSSCIEYINMSIRNDEENKFLMRAPMTELDEQIIRTSIENPLGLSDDDLRSWMCIQKRMENERIYEALR